MGKRSNFERRERDLYPTPARAVLPLLPWLRAGGVQRFAEPCCGDGDLVGHLETFGLICTYAGDVTDGRNALELTVADLAGADAIITNPPHSRPLMHAMLGHFLGLGLPTWLLIDHDWVQNLHATPFLPKCSDIVAIGRVRWFEGSPHTGKENYAWFRFSDAHRGATAIRHRHEQPASRTVACEQCGRSFQPQRSTARFCSEACRQRAHRAGPLA